jgi:hypothetical protein
MRICVVFGAGASLANGMYFHGERMQDRNPPLDTTFFAKIRALEIPVESDLRHYAEALPTGSPFDPRTPDGRIEEFFRDLFFDFLNEGEAETPTTRAYTALVNLYRRVIGETTDWLCEDGRKGAWVGRLIAAASDAAEIVTLLTFNQDLVIENEIFKRGRLRRTWCLEHAYGSFSNDREHTSSTRAEDFPQHGEDCDGGERLRVLKLHGSLNWYVRMNGRQPSPRVLAGTAGDRKVIITRRRTVPVQLRYTRKRGGRGRTSWYTWPVVIPPVFAKQALIQAFVPEVWADAKEALESADRVVFFGYSLPAADIDAEKLFQRAILANNNIEKVDVIDPQPAIAGRYASLLPTKPLTWYPSVRRFLALEPFASR